MSSQPSGLPNRAIEAVRPSRLADEVANRLRDYIVTNELSAGDRLPSERQLSAQLATSRATVSQALRTLSIAGLVEVRHGSGAYVRTDPYSLLGVSFDLMFDPGSVDELAEFRQWIEDGLFSLASDISIDDAEVKSAFDELQRRDASIGEFIEADARFHIALVAGARNPYLTSLFEAVHRQILQVTYASWIESGRSPRWLDGDQFDGQIEVHRRIMEAALGGKTSDLRDALADHGRSLMEHVEMSHKGRS